jgi:hypothetical protein
MPVKGEERVDRRDEKSSTRTLGPERERSTAVREARDSSLKGTAPGYVRAASGTAEAESHAVSRLTGKRQRDGKGKAGVETARNGTERRGSQTLAQERD